MPKTPARIQEFLQAHTLAVAGVSRDRNQPANAIFRKLRDSGRSVYAVNPNASSVEDAPCFHDLRAIGTRVDGLVIAAPPAAALSLVQQCAELGISRVWFHRSFGQGSVSEPAVAECRARGLACIVGGCPMMYREPVDWAHRCMRWVLRWPGRD